MDRSRASAISAAASLCYRGLLIAAAVTFSVPGSARAGPLKLAVGAPNNWENQPAMLGQQAGIFKKHGLVLDILFTQGSGEPMRPSSPAAPMSARASALTAPWERSPRAPQCGRSPMQRRVRTISIGTCARSRPSSR